jgi:glycosyltransferase involved in cell wall biosynthesis
MIPGLESAAAPCISIAIFAWNEEEAIGATLNSLFHQSIFAQLNARGERCEVICVLNGCTDRTPEVAVEVFAAQHRQHPYPNSFTSRVANIAERGKINAWNQFVHSLSAKESHYLFMMDADIHIHRHETLWNMFLTLERDANARVAVDLPCKDISFKRRKSLGERMSLSMSRMTRAADGQLCGQLYGIRSETARNIYLPKDLAACEDGFIKALVCTDFVTRPSSPARIRVADNAEHTFEAYTSPRTIVRNQKRQVIGQTIVHILVDNFLPRLPLSERLRLGQALKDKENTDPAWLKKLIAAHLRQARFFWRLYPGLLHQRFKHLANLSWPRKVACFPSAAASVLVALASSYLAWVALKAGSTDYWPKAKRLKSTTTTEPGRWELTQPAATRSKL